MSVKFVRKSYPAKIENITRELTQFLLENKQYLDLTLGIIFTVKEPTNKICDRINNKLNICNEIDISSKENLGIYSEYCNKMSQFYSLSEDNLKKNRGYLLEEISCNIKLCQKCIDEQKYVLHQEAQVYKDSSLISDKDIDIVFEHCADDIIECKVCLRFFLKPFNHEHIEKLEYLEEVKKILSDSGKKVNLHMLSLDKKKEKLQEILESYGFTSFNLINKEDIVQNILNC